MQFVCGVRSRQGVGRLAIQARAVWLDVLCEVHSEQELARALDAGCT